MDINGHTVIDRAGIAELTGAALSTVDKWYRNRQRYRFPPRPDDVHGAWWYLDDIEKFWDHYRKHTVPHLTAWTAPATPTNSSAHHKLPVSSATTPPLTYPQHYWTSPTTSHHYPLDGNAANGDDTPSGPGQTTTSATAAPEDPQAPKPRGTIDHNGDPDELVNSTEAARILGYAHRKHLPPDLLNHADHTQHMTDGRQRRTWRRQTLWNWKNQKTTLR